MSFIAGALIVGGASTLLGTGAQIWGSNQAKNTQNALAMAHQGVSGKIRGEADEKFRQATEALQKNYQNQLTQRQDLTDNQLSQLGSQMAMYNQLASQGVPDATKAMIMQQANRAVGNQMASAESARGSLGAAARGNQTLKDTYMQLGSMDAQQRLQNKQMQAQAQGAYANQVGALQRGDLDWQQAAYNQAFVDPQYQQAAMQYGQANKQQDYAAALQGAAMQNQSQMWNQLGQGLTQLGGYGMGYGMSNMGGGGNSMPSYS